MEQSKVMPAKIILAIDQGTTGTTVLAFDSSLKVLGKATCEFKQHYPKPGWVEHKAADIWRSVANATQACLKNAQIAGQDISTIGITNQRETTCMFDKLSQPLHNFIVWQCRRTTEMCERLKKQDVEDVVRQKTGLVLDPYFSGTKLSWLLQNINGTAQKASSGEALFGTIDTWLVFCLSGNKTFVTDATNASRTLMMNLETCDWDSQLLDLLNVPGECLPKICSSSEVYGYTYGLDFLPDGIPIAGIAGDQQAALFGQACFEPGDCKATYGTGSFILMNTGKEIIRSKNGLLSSVAIKIGANTQYCLEGSAFVAGAAVQWLRDGLGLIKDASEIEDLALQSKDSQEVVFVPALTGLGAPYWRPKARGMLGGIGRDTNKSHIARAVLEGICLLNRDIIDAMGKDAGHLSGLKVDGGASANNLLMQIQADVLDSSCVRPKIVETSALGAAALAGLSTGVFKNKDTFKQSWQVDQIFSPKLDSQLRGRLQDKWTKAITRA